MVCVVCAMEVASYSVLRSMPEMREVRVETPFIELSNFAQAWSDWSTLCVWPWQQTGLGVLDASVCC